MNDKELEEVLFLLDTVRDVAKGVGDKAREVGNAV
jgi:hypothetical protein